MKNNQAGGIVTFVIIGLVLAALLGGGLYASKQMGRADRTNDTSTPQVVQNNDKVQSEDDKDAPAPTPTPKPETKPQPQAVTPPATTSPTNRVATTGPSDALPSTGPVETGAAIFVLGGLTFAIFRHAQSRRELRRNALRR